MTLPHRDFGWRYDLPSPNTPPISNTKIKHVYPCPNNLDMYYLELPRSLFKIRGFSATGGIILLAIGAIPTLALSTSAFTAVKSDLTPTTIILSTVFFMFYITIPYIRMDIEHPRDTPIRFNRHHRKVYFYEYRFDRLHPLGRKNWGIRPVVYDWDDLTAEVYSIYAPLGYGGQIEKVMIAVRKPGTDEVIDRLLFADDIEKGKQYWAIARLFMQEGPEALPDFVYAPTDWNSDDISNPFERLAPKVQWPAEMDLESRTAPSHEEQLR